MIQPGEALYVSTFLFLSLFVLFFYLVFREIKKRKKRPGQEMLKKKKKNNLDGLFHPVPIKVFNR